MPPRAAMMRAPGVARSAISCSSSSSTCVPTGTRSSTVSPVAPCFSAPRPGSPLPALKRRFGPKGGEVTKVGVGDEDDVSPGTAVATIGPTFRDVLLTPEMQTAVAAATRLDLNCGSILKHAGTLAP